MPVLAPVFVTPELVQVVGGKLHLIYEVGGRRLDDPRCNLDDASRRMTVSPDLLAEVDRDRLCSFCFGDN